MAAAVLTKMAKQSSRSGVVGGRMAKGKQKSVLGGEVG